VKKNEKHSVEILIFFQQRDMKKAENVITK